MIGDMIDYEILLGESPRKTKTVTGHLIFIERLPQFQFAFMEQDAGFILTEISSGLLISRGRTITKMIAAANRTIDSNGIANAIERILAVGGKSKYPPIEINIEFNH